VFDNIEEQIFDREGGVYLLYVFSFIFVVVCTYISDALFFNILPLYLNFLFKNVSKYSTKADNKIKVLYFVITYAYSREF
jgi:hypothetical protein